MSHAIKRQKNREQKKLLSCEWDFKYPVRRLPDSHIKDYTQKQIKSQSILVKDKKNNMKRKIWINLLKILGVVFVAILLWYVVYTFNQVEI